MTHDNTRISRRNVLKAIGVGAVGTSSLTRIAGAENRTEVVVARGGRDDEPRYTEEVPTKWYEHNQAIRKARDRLVRQVESLEFVNGSRLTPSSEAIEDITYSQIELTVDPQTPDEKLASLPSTLEEAGVSVPFDVVVSEISVVRDSVELTTVNCTDNLKTDLPFPAGYFTQHFFDSGSKVSYSTAGYRVYDENAGEERMLTANHVITPGECTLGDGKELSDYDGDLIGWGTTKGNYGLDWILLHPVVSLAEEIYDDLDGRQTLHGLVTKDGADTIMNKGYTVENYGSLTGYDSGNIENLAASATAGCVNLFSQGVTVSCRTGNGDSGGPVWFDTLGDRYIIGHNSMAPETKTKSCSPLGDDAKYGSSGTFYPFFRIKSNNSELKVGDTKYTG